MKICSKCGESKELNEYNSFKYKPKKDGSQKIGVRTYCKKCQYVFTKNFFDKNIGYKKQWRCNNPEKLKEENLRAKPRITKWRIENKDVLKAKKRIYRENNKDAIYANKKIDQEKQIKILSDRYVVGLLSKRTKLNTSEIRKYPELIEAHKLTIKIKRLCKTSNS